MTRPANLERGNQASQLARFGPLVDRDLLLHYILPATQKEGISAFARRAGVHEDSVRHFVNGTNGRQRVRLDFADKLLTTGLGRPDLVDVVCPPEQR